jgi:subtilisin
MQWRSVVAFGALIAIVQACSERTGPVAESSEPAMSVNPSVQGRMVSVFLHYKTGAPAGRLKAVMAAGARRALDDPRDGLLSIEMPEQQAQALKKLPWVARLTIQPTTVFPTVDVLPWGVDYTNADYVRTKYNDIGAGVKVATLDDGIDCSHSDLAPAGGFDFVNMSPIFCAGGGHGTPVAGIIAAAVNATDVVGMAPGVSLFSVRICGDNDGCPDARIRDGLQWAIENGMKVVNMSLGNCGQDLSQEVQDKIVAAYNAGITIVAAAGNGPHSFGGCLATDPVAKPAAYPNVIAVTALFQNETQPADYQYGPEVDIAAPTNVLSDRLGGGTETFGGTSAATPHVAGAAALIIGRGNFLEPSSVRTALQMWAKDLGTAGWDDHFGNGALRADWSTIPAAAVTAITGPQNFTSPDSGTYVATVERGDAPLQVRWRVFYVNNGVTTDFTTGWSSSTSFGYSWPAGAYTAQLTATPLETIGRIGFAGTISIVVCTTGPSPIAGTTQLRAASGDDPGIVVPMAKGGCGGPPPGPRP